MLPMTWILALARLHICLGNWPGQLFRAVSKGKIHSISEVQNSAEANQSEFLASYTAIYTYLTLRGVCSSKPTLLPVPISLGSPRPRETETSLAYIVRAECGTNRQEGQRGMQKTGGKADCVWRERGGQEGSSRGRIIFFFLSPN